MSDIWSEDFEEEFGDWRRQDDAGALSAAGIAEQNGMLLRRYREFRRAADAVAERWRQFPEVERIALIGSLARAPWKEVPRFSPYRKMKVELWHECKDLDLAVWLASLDGLNGLRQAKNRALHDRHQAGEPSLASHQVDTFILEPATDRYLGRLCQFNRCPKGKHECLVPGCGATAFLQQHAGFRWRPESLADGRMVGLFDRATGRIGRAADLPLPLE